MAHTSTQVVSYAPSRVRGGTHVRRLLLAILIAVLALMAVMFIPAHALAKSSTASIVGAKTYYLALGDSLAFGYQPNGDWSHGYAQDFAANLKNHGGSSFTDYGCNGETSTTMIKGGCPYWYALHNYYFGAQLTAAVNFIKKHAGSVSPVSLDIGANDLLPDFNASTCTVNQTSFNTHFATLQSNLPTILSSLKNALAGKGDLVMMTYYNVYANQCASSPNLPQMNSDLDQLNQLIVSDAQTYGALVANGRAAIPDSSVCADTWICNATYHDIHANSTGYSLLAGAFESVTGY